MAGKRARPDVAEMVLPAIQLGGEAWRNVVKALRTHDDAHLAACAEAIEWQMDRLDKAFGAEPGRVDFVVNATLKAASEDEVGASRL